MIKARLKRKTVENFIRNRTVEKKMRLADVGRLAGVSSGYWTQVLSGKRFPSPRVRERLMRVMGLGEKQWGKLFVSVNGKKK